MSGAESLRDARLKVRSGRIVVLVCAMPFKCPGAPNEAEVVAHNIARAIIGKGDLQRFTGAGECFIETGDGRAAFGGGDFYADPAPQINLKQPSLIMHLGKVAYEKYWLFKWF